jgi:competence protein ComEC
MSRPTDEERPRGYLIAPLLAISAAFALGIAAVDAPHATLSRTLAETPALLALAGGALLVGLILVRAKRAAFAGIIALVGFALAGSIAARLFEFRFPPAHVSHLEGLGIDLRDPVRVSGRIVSAPLETPSGVQFDLELSALEDRGHSLPLAGRVRLRLRRGQDARSAALADSLRLRYGDSIRALATLEKPTAYRDPGVFDFRRWLASIHDVYWVGTIKNPLLVEKLPRQSSPAPGELVVRARQSLLDGIDRLYPPWSLQGRYGSVLKAVLLGDRSALDSDTIEKFRVTGLYHLLVISGLHVGLLALLAGLLLRLTPLGESWRSALVLLFLLGYCSLVEMRAPTVRATIMIAAYLVARFFYRQHAALNAVGLAALILLVVRPPWLFEAGFELSFAAALLIVGLVAPILERTIEPYRRALRNVSDVSLDLSMAPRAAQFRLDVRQMAGWLEGRIRGLENYPAVAMATVTWPLRAVLWAVGMIVFTAILQIGLMLPLAATFHRVTFAGIGLNALAIPVMIVLLAVAVPTVLLSAVWPAIAVWPAKLLALVMQALFLLTDLPHLPPWLSYRVPTPPAWLGWAFALSLVATAWGLGRTRWMFRLAAAGAMVLAGIISVAPFSPRVQAGRLEVTALDCGAGDAFLVVLPDQTTMLIDAGDRGRVGSVDPFESRRWDAGEDVVSPFLWSQQIKRVDIVVMSRGEEGELPGFAAIARNFQIGEMWHAASGLSPKTLGFLDELERRGIRLRAVEAGDRFVRGSTSVQIFWPPGARSEAQTGSSAGGGIVLKIENGGSSVLFARALDRTMEQSLADSGAPLRASVLAIAGSSFPASASKDFLASVSPRVLLLSGEGRNVPDPFPSGLSSDYQLPGWHLFRAQLDGAVTVELQGRTIAVHPYGRAAGEGTSGLGSAASFTSSSSVR